MTTAYVVDVSGSLPHVLEEHRDDGQATVYLYGAGVMGVESDGALVYQHADALGSVRQQTDESGRVRQARAYAPFGEGLSAAGEAAGSFGFAGEQHDAASGLIYLRARCYDPATGRFLTRDAYPAYAPVPQTLHRYAYCWNDPVRHTDPSGHAIAMEEDFTLIARPDGTYRVAEGGQHFRNPMEIAFANWYLSGGEDHYLERAFASIGWDTSDGAAYGWAITNHTIRYVEAELYGNGATAHFVHPAAAYLISQGVVDSFTSGSPPSVYPDARPGGFETSREAELREIREADALINDVIETEFANVNLT